MKVLLASATYHEIAPFVERLKKKVVQNNFYSGKINSVETDCLITGIGTVAATFALTKCLQINKYDLIINIGIAGSFNNELAIGSVVMVTSDCFADLGVDDNGNFRSIFQEKFMEPNAFPFQNGSLLSNMDLSVANSIKKAKGITVNTATGSNERIKFLKDRYNPDIESMEGAAIAYTCLMENVKYLQIRAISNKIEPRDKKNWNISLAIKNLTSTLIDIFTSQNFIL